MFKKINENHDTTLGNHRNTMARPKENQGETVGKYKKTTGKRVQNDAKT